MVLGLFIFDGYETSMLLLALPFAALGGLISFLVTKFCPQGNYVDPRVVPVPTVMVAPNGSPVYSNPNVPAYMINQVPAGIAAQPMQVQPVQVQPVQAQPAGVSGGLRYCKYCGAPNQRTNNFCESCGHVFE